MKTNQYSIEEIQEKELDTWCKTLLDYTKAMIDNPTIANKWIFDRATHDEWVLMKFPKRLASVKAYDEFYNLTGKDIRDYDWLSSAKAKDGSKFVVHQRFVDEHMTTAFDFKNKLLKLCDEGKLDENKIKELVAMQRLCWITKEENDKLNLLGYRQSRENPLEAYERCGIEIYDKENADLSNIQTNPRDKVTCSKSQNAFPQTKTDIAGLKDEEKIRRNFFDNLAQYFKENYPDFFIKYQNDCEHFDIRKTCDLTFDKIMVNARVVNGCLKDVCVFFMNKDAKAVYEKLYAQKKEIESQIGYELVWDRNDGKIATRIGRFGKYYRKKAVRRLNDPIFDTENYTNFDFDLDVSKVANELVNIYNAFMPKVKKILLNF